MINKSPIHLNTAQTEAWRVLDVINQSTRCGNDHIRILPQYQLLRLHVQSTNGEAHFDRRKLRQLLRHLVDLGAQFSRRHQHQDAGHTLIRRTVDQSLECGQHVGGCLARARRCTAANVAAEQGDGDGGGLDGRGVDKAEDTDGAHQGTGEVHLVEGGDLLVAQRLLHHRLPVLVVLVLWLGAVPTFLLPPLCVLDAQPVVLQLVVAEVNVLGAL